MEVRIVTEVCVPFSTMHLQSSARAQILSVYVVSGNSRDHEHPHGLQHQHVPRPSTGFLVAVLPADNNMALCPSMATDQPGR